MSRNKKPRKAYRPKPVCADPMALARHHACKPAKEDRQQVLDALRDAVKALREGVATEMDWSVAAGSLALAQAIERRGIVRGLQTEIADTESVLQKIYDRAIRMGEGRWVRVTLHADEIKALADFVTLHRFQFDQLGRAEILDAMQGAQKTITKDGHVSIFETRVTHHEVC